MCSSDLVNETAMRLRSKQSPRSPKYRHYYSCKIMVLCNLAAACSRCSHAFGGRACVSVIEKLPMWTWIHPVFNHIADAGHARALVGAALAANSARGISKGRGFISAAQGQDIDEAPDEAPKRRTKPPKDGGQVPAYTLRYRQGRALHLCAAAHRG